MLIQNRTEFIKYFDSLLIENGIRDICKRCNEGKFLDIDNRVGCCSDCEHLSKNGCTNKNTSCVLASCSIIEKLHPNINYYLELIQFLAHAWVYQREDADIPFPFKIPKFDSEIDWKERFTEITGFGSSTNRY